MLNKQLLNHLLLYKAKKMPENKHFQALLNGADGI